MIYGASSGSHFDTVKDQNITNYLNTIHRFEGDSSLTNTDRIDTLKTTHLITAEQLGTIQHWQEQNNPYNWLVFASLDCFIVAFIFGAITQTCYDDIKEQREKFPREPL